MSVTNVEVSRTLEARPVTPFCKTRTSKGNVRHKKLTTTRYAVTVTLAKATFGCCANPTLHANIADSYSFNPMFALGLQHPSMAMLQLAPTRPTPTLVCISKPAPQTEAKFVMARNNTRHITSLRRCHNMHPSLHCSSNNRRSICDRHATIRRMWSGAHTTSCSCGTQQ